MGNYEPDLKQIGAAHNDFHRRFQSLGRLLENEHFCLDEVVKKQLEKLDCFIGNSHLLPCFIWLERVSWGCAYTCSESVCM